MTIFEKLEDAEKYLAENVQFNSEIFIKERAVRVDGKRGRPMKDGSTEMKTVYVISQGRPGRPRTKAKKETTTTNEKELVGAGTSGGLDMEV